VERDAPHSAPLDVQDVPKEVQRLVVAAAGSLGVVSHHGGTQQIQVGCVAQYRVKAPGAGLLRGVDAAGRQPPVGHVQHGAHFPQALDDGVIPEVLPAVDTPAEIRLHLPRGG